MKRIAVFAVLAVLLVVGVVMFMQQSEQGLQPETVAETATVVETPEVAP